MAEICLLVRIKGRVQGVGFRYHTCNKARELGIKGWVRNCPDGSVEASICGHQDNIDAMKAWLSHGPDWAKVDDISFISTPDPEQCDDFSIR